MNIPRLADLVGRHFSDHAAQFGLVTDRVTATYVLNWGGFVNYSFTVITSSWESQVSRSDSNSGDRSTPPSKTDITPLGWLAG